MPTPVQADIRAGLDRLGPGEPIIVVAVSADHAPLLDNWLRHLDRLGIERVLIVAMDGRLALRMGAGRHPVVRAGFDGSMTDFWRQRALVWHHLAEAGATFIQSDTDAVWLRDPRTLLTATQGDLLVSQGTWLPEDAALQWGFVLCCGFFLARPSAASRRLFAALAACAMAEPGFDDQVRLNQMLAAEAIGWDRRADGYAVWHGGRAFTAFPTALAGHCATFDLAVTLLPHHLFPRIQAGTPDAMVRHVLRGNDPATRIDELRAAGCWLDDPTAEPG